MFTEEEEEDESDAIIHLLVVGFHHKKGHQVIEREKNVTLTFVKD